MTALDTAGPGPVRTAVPASSRPRPTSWWHGRHTRLVPTRSSRREVLLVAGLYLAYAVSRLPSLAPAGAAQTDGRTILHLERLLHIDIERPLDNLLHAAPQFVSIAAAYYYESLHYLVTAATLVWLYRRRPQLYRRARTWLVALTFPALIVFWLFPVTPPRSLPGSGVRDVMAEQHQWGWWGTNGGTAPSGLAGLVNHTAAMPSLHVAWSLWVGWHLVRTASRQWVRTLGGAYPVLTALVVLSTGNHYLLDVLAGVGVTVLGRFLAQRVHRPSRRTVMRTAVAVVLGVDVALVAPTVADTLPDLAGISRGWLLVALGCQVVSIAHFVGLQRLFLIAAGVRVRWRSAASAVLAGTALSLTIPGGSVLSVAYVSKRMRRWGATTGMVSFAFAASGVLCTVALLGVSTFGTAVRGDTTGLAWTVVQLAMGALAFSVLLVLLRRPDAAQVRLRRVGNRLAVRVAEAVVQVAAIGRPTRTIWTEGFVLAAMKWLADLACLYAAVRAVGAHTSVTMIVVTYVAGAAAISVVPLLPGGIGVVDATLLATLHAGGVALGPATTAVLLYRLISLGLVSVSGWSLLVADQRHTRSRSHPRTMTA